MAFWNSWFKGNRGSNPQPQGEDERREDTRNPATKYFAQATNNIAAIIDRRSVVSKDMEGDYNTAGYHSDVTFAGITAMPVVTNKRERIKIYRQMAQFSECDFCLDQIADDIIHEDENGDFVRLEFSERKKLKPTRREVLKDEFNRYIELFHFRDNAFNMIKRLLIDGELAYENIINTEKPALGIIGVKYLPTENYETLMDVDTGKTVGIFFNTKEMKQDIKNVVSNSFFNNQTVFDTYSGMNYSMYTKDDCIPLLWPQVTYFSTGTTSPDGLINYSLLEKCKQPYHQLALMQDAAVILRVTRAPERLLFNIDTGLMSDKVAKDYVRNFMNQLKSKKVVSSVLDQNGKEKDIQSVYNPVSMLESYYFQKGKESSGTTIESVGSSADYEQIADIEFFLRKLFKAFKVPFSRYKTPEGTVEKADAITYEEYDFAREVIRFQRRLALGLKAGYITHLKLRGIWDQYQLKESDVKVSFTPPVLYDLYQRQKLVIAKMDTYKAIVDQDELSKIIAMKKYLGMTDEEIHENFRYLIKEKMYVQLADWYSDQINEKGGPLDYDPPIPLKDDTKGSENKGEEGEEPAEGGEEAAESPEPAEGGKEEEQQAEQPAEGGEAETAAEPGFGLGNA